VVNRRSTPPFNTAALHHASRLAPHGETEPTRQFAVRSSAAVNGLSGVDANAA
jgi:hypothetical protein